MNQKIPAHGGDIVSASQQYHIEVDQWLDLSTGINPSAYPVELEANSFQQLPYIRPEFIAASSHYYQCSQFIPVSGTQAAIQQLPKLLADFPVLLPKLGYKEHLKYWQEKATNIGTYCSEEKATMIKEINQALAVNPQQHLVVINPNNPTAVLIDKTQLFDWAHQLAQKAYLIIDEAFIDTDKQQSLLSDNLPDNIIVLRSFGKFFGLAGIRLGYCFASQKILALLQENLGLWQVNGPAQSLAIRALNDHKWQAQALCDIASNSRLMQSLWEPLLDKYTAHKNTVNRVKKYYAPLFLSYQLAMDDALFISKYFAKSGILLRVIAIESSSHQQKNTQALLRIGLIDRHNQDTLNTLVNGINLFMRDICHHKVSHS